VVGAAKYPERGPYVQDIRLFRDPLTAGLPKIHMYELYIQWVNSYRQTFGQKSLLKLRQRDNQPLIPFEGGDWVRKYGFRLYGKTDETIDR
jgi:hypothetical protein